jgi:hypothetical protein
MKAYLGTVRFNHNDKALIKAIVKKSQRIARHDRKLIARRTRSVPNEKPLMEKGSQHRDKAHH